MRPRPHCLTHGETVRSAADVRSIRCRFHEQGAVSPMPLGWDESDASGQTRSRRASPIGRAASRQSPIAGRTPRRAEPAVCIDRQLGRGWSRDASPSSATGVRPATAMSDSYGLAARQPPQRSKRSWRRRSFASRFSAKARHRLHAVGVAPAASVAGERVRQVAMARRRRWTSPGSVESGCLCRSCCWQP